jgi:hypothetical protein
VFAWARVDVLLDQEATDELNGNQNTDHATSAAHRIHAGQCLLPAKKSGLVLSRHRLVRTGMRQISFLLCGEGGCRAANKGATDQADGPGPGRFFSPADAIALITASMSTGLTR